MEIETAMAAQEKCWNTGDLECFMAPYWHSERLTFVTSKGVTTGWQATLDRHKKSYPTQKAMGQLTFGVLSMETIGSDHIYMIGTWELVKEDQEDAKGLFTLIWKHIEGKWQIIADHSS